MIHEAGSTGRPAPVIDVLIDGERWTREEHLHQSQSFDTHYTAAPDNSGRLWLEFGDGVRGREIKVDRNSRLPLVSIRLEYRIGEPLDGNCARDTLTEVVEPAGTGFQGLGVTRSATSHPASGGSAGTRWTRSARGSRCRCSTAMGTRWSSS